MATQQETDTDSEMWPVTSRQVDAAVVELASIYEALDCDGLTDAEIDDLIARRRELEQLVEAAGTTHPRGDR